MATMADVARHAGVSVKTVSNVLSGHPHVRDTTRDRVLASVDALGYEINVTAKIFRSGRSGVVGLSVPELGSPTSVSWPTRSSPPPEARAAGAHRADGLHPRGRARALRCPAADWSTA